MRSRSGPLLLILWLFIRGAIIGLPLLVVLWMGNEWWFNEWPTELVVVRRDGNTWFVQTHWTANGVGHLACVANPRDLKEWKGKLREFTHHDNRTVDGLLAQLTKENSLIVLEYGRLLPHSTGYFIADDNKYLVMHDIATFLYHGQPTHIPTGLRWSGVLFWLILLSLIGNTIWVVLRSPFRWLACRRQLRLVGHCHRCGYDLAGLSPGAACPECGHRRLRP